MLIIVLREKKNGENRVSLTPDMVKRYIDLGFSVRVESGAGEASGFLDQMYINAGAEISKTNVLDGANIVLCVNTPHPDDLKKIPDHASLIGQLKPFEVEQFLESFNAKKLNTFAVEMLPRITRAQSMDVLSSQANLAGYRAVIDATYEFNHAFPLMMTAAGTVPAARVLILGVGVAGLQAIATAKRLGAIVSAYDVRPEVKEQIKSLGATPIEVDFKEDGAGEGGYAKEMSAAYKVAEKECLKNAASKSDIIITTALIPGKKAPILVTKEMIELMKPGSVIVDMACESGGNCEGSIKDKVTIRDDVKIIGYTNMASRISYNASQLYAKNLYTFINTLFIKKDDIFEPDWSDELIIETLLTKDGKTVHKRFLDKQKEGASDKNAPLKEVIKKTSEKKAIQNKKTTENKDVKKTGKSSTVKDNA